MAHSIQFSKMQGLQNDFVIIDNTSYKLTLSNSQIKFICNRKLGIGCDQLLLIEKQANLINHYHYKIFNQDGSSANHCGNGARCVIKYLYLNDSTVNLTLPITLHTANTIISGSGEFPYTDILVTIGKASFEPADIPFINPKLANNVYTATIDKQAIEFGVVTVGNPHAVVRLDHKQQLDNKEYLKQIAVYLQNSPMFPDSVNVNFYTLINRKQIFLITYERGVGFTEACGTGACAAVAYTINQNLTDNDVLVAVPGGNLSINVDKQQQINMRGEAVEVFNGCLQL
jgi:diaminopimelate epimerase